MIDIHSHLIPFVDDGSDSMESSVKKIIQAKKIGITDIICTPHFRYGKYQNDKEIIKAEFDKLYTEIKKKGININLYLGEEIHISSAFKEDLKNGKYITLNNSKYILLELNNKNEITIEDIVYYLSYNGYKVVIAHYERYDDFSLETAMRIVDNGGEIQINATSLMFSRMSKYKKRCTLLLDNNLVQYVASDVHVVRANALKKAYKYIKKEYSKNLADKLFEENQKKILE